MDQWIFDHRIKAETNRRYFAHMSARYKMIDLILIISIATLIALVFLWGVWSNYSPITLAPLSLAALIGASMRKYRFFKNHLKYSLLSSIWGFLSQDLERAQGLSQLPTYERERLEKDYKEAIWGNQPNYSRGPAKRIMAQVVKEQGEK